MYPELEIFLYRRGEAEFDPVLILRDPDSAVPPRWEGNEGGSDLVRLDTREFGRDPLASDPRAYGLALGRALFAPPHVRTAIDHARALALTKGRELRVRLCTDQRSLKLHRLRWETLRLPDAPDPDAGDPDGARWLGGDPAVLFSRHLFSGDMRPVRLRPKADLSALIAVASPTDVGTYADERNRPLAPLDVAAEFATAEDGLHSLRQPVGRLGGASGRATMARLLEGLQAEPDVFYLACHGAVIAGEPRLLLENEDGTAALASGMDLVRGFAGLRTLPRLVVLISCQSGGGGDDVGRPLAGVGQRLAEAGVAAVLAMQGDLRMDTARGFLPPFFKELSESGQIDKAVALGRAAVRQQPDAWVPVLYTRLVDGRVWFTKGLRAAGEFDAWDQLIRHVASGRCVPILGSGLLEPFLGTTRELANELAKDQGYPLSLSGREDLPQVLQFLKTMKDDFYARDRLFDVGAEAVRARLRLSESEAPDPLGTLLGRAWGGYRPTADGVADPAEVEPHRFLANLGKFKTVITTNPDDLLEKAFAAAGRPARVHRFRWADGLEREPGSRGTADDLEPTFERPHIHQLFGSLSDAESMVLTEDDYFRFLTTTTRRVGRKGRDSDDLGDTLLRGTLVNSALIFLGFRIADWDFRTLFRLLLDQEGKTMRSKMTHIAVQIDPEDGTHGNAAQARGYIEKLFVELVGGAGKIAVYWGSTEDFIQDLHRRWRQR